MKLFLLFLFTALLFAQPPKPLHSQASSSIDYSTAADGSNTVEIRNVAYEITGTNVPGRPPDDRLLLRKITRTKEVLGDIGVEANLTLEAWRLGDDLRNRALYTLTASGDDGTVHDNALFVVSRGLEEVEWWSVYKLGNGQHLFDTYLPVVSFSISRETVTTRYVGLDVPSDNEADVRLKQPNVVAILTYASESRIIRELLLTCDDKQQAKLLRSYADITRTISVNESQPRTITLNFRQNYPSPPNPRDVVIRLAGDDLDLNTAQLPPKMHLAAWRR